MNEIIKQLQDLVYQKIVFAVGVRKWSDGSNWFNTKDVKCFLSKENAYLNIAESLEAEAKELRKKGEGE